MSAKAILAMFESKDSDKEYEDQLVATTTNDIGMLKKFYDKSGNKQKSGVCDDILKLMKGL